MENYRDKIQKDVDNGLNVHNQYKSLTVDELKEVQRSETFPFAVCLLSVTGDLNIGVAIRSALLHGAQKAIVYGRRKFDNRSLVGAQNYIDIERIEGFDDEGNLCPLKWQQYLDLYNYYPVYCETGGIELQNARWNNIINSADDYNCIPLLIFGAEGTGIPESFIMNYDIKISIPQRGVLRSFNVSAAMSMICWDLRSKMGWF